MHVILHATMSHVVRDNQVEEGNGGCTQGQAVVAGS